MKEEVESAMIEALYPSEADLQVAYLRLRARRLEEDAKKLLLEADLAERRLLAADAARRA